MQNALRKQRDVELLRVKKEDEEELALRARKTGLLDKAARGSSTDGPQAAPAVKGESLSAGAADLSTLDMLASKDSLLDPTNSAILEAAKENEHIVRRIQGRLDKIRHDVNAGRVSPADARAKLDQANSEMAEAERKNNQFRQMIFDAEPALSHFQQPDSANLSTALQNTLASSNSDAFSQALGVIKSFFSASDPIDVQSAISDLRSVLEINGSMSPVLQKSVQALEDMLAKPNSKGFTVDVATADGKTRTCNTVVEVMMNYRMRMQASNNPAAIFDPALNAGLNLDQDTIKANLECIKVEDAAKKDMEKLADKMADDTVENVTAAMKKIKAKAVLRSPIPPVSDIVLDDVIAEILFRRSIKGLLTEAANGETVNQLSGKITSLVIATAQNKPYRYLAALDLVKHTIGKMRGQKEKASQTLVAAVSKVQESMAKFVAAYEQKQKTAAPVSSNASSVLSATSDKPAPDMVKSTASTKYLLDGTLVSEESWDVFLEFIDTPLVDEPDTVQDRVIGHYREHIDEGIWDIFRAIACRPPSTTFYFEPWDIEKEFYRSNMNLAAASGPENLLEAIAKYQKLGACPAMTAIVLAQRLTYRVREDFETATANALKLQNIVGQCDQAGNRDWFQTFKFITQAVRDLFAIIFFRVSTLNVEDGPFVAADVVGIVCTFVLGVADPNQSQENLQVIQRFVTETLLECEEEKEHGKLGDILSRFSHMCQDSRYRCSQEHVCRARVRQLNMESMKPLAPAPLRPKWIGYQILKSPSSTLAPWEFSQLPRHVQLREQVRKGWEKAIGELPHLLCLTAKQMCRCLPGPQVVAAELLELKAILNLDFAEVDSCIRRGTAPPKALLDQIASHEATLSHESNYAPFQPPADSDKRALQYALAKARHIKLKQVAVGVPSVQKCLPCSSSEWSNFEKAAQQLKDSIEADNVSATADAAKASLSQSLSPANVRDEQSLSSPPAMSERELEIKNKLATFVSGMFRLDRAGSPFYGLTHNGGTQNKVSRQLRTIADGHIEMAWIIAKARGYLGLQAWLGSKYPGTRPESAKLAGPGPSGARPNGEKGDTIKKVQPISLGKGMQPATAATAATAGPSEHQVQPLANEGERLGREFLQRMEIVSEPRRRLPKRKA
jgi:hypothetical protein